MPLAGILNGALERTRTLECGPARLNALQEAAYNFPCKPIIAMDALSASQLAYRAPIAPAGAGAGMSYFLCIAAAMAPKLRGILGISAS